MRVLMLNRIDAMTHLGGDTIQMLNTKSELEQLGVSVDLSLDISADPRGYDVVHLFNLTRVHETYLHAMRARNYGIPIALSTVYWNLEELDQRAGHGAATALGRLVGPEAGQRLKSIWRFVSGKEVNWATLVHIWLGHRREQLATLRAAAVLLPNSQLELGEVERDFGPVSCPVCVVPNAVSSAFGGGRAEVFTSRYGLRDFVLCVGRIEPRKNQLQLVEALRGLGVPIVLIGYPNRNHLGYYRTLKAAAGKDVHFLPPMDQHELIHAYAAAHVHIQPSWAETPGLASLEAAAAGCNIVVTNRGSAIEYFRDLAWYCDPSDPNSIRQAVVNALRSPRNRAASEHVLIQFSWRRAATLTLEAYEKVAK